jgi:hypothetical protein
MAILSSNTGPLSSEVVNGGLPDHIPNVEHLPKVTQPTSPTNATMEIVYETEDFSDRQRGQRLAAALKRRLTAGAVIFEFTATDRDPVMVVEEIAQQLGDVIGYTNVNKYVRHTKGLILEIAFKSQIDSVREDLKVNINGEVVKGYRWVDEMKRKTVQVDLPYVPLRIYNNLSTKLRSALAPYGTVLQVCKYTDPKGRFIGQASVFLDRGDKSCITEEFLDLPKLIRLEEENVFIPTVYKETPKVCLQCRCAGHERRSCPELASVYCSRCKGYGHVDFLCHETDPRTLLQIPQHQPEDRLPKRNSLVVANSKNANDDNRDDEATAKSVISMTSSSKDTNDKDTYPVRIRTNETSVKKVEKRVNEGKKRHSMKDIGAPSRGLSAYMFFSQTHRKTLQDENPDAGFGQIGKALGDKWKDMSEKEKQPYIAHAEAVMNRYYEEELAYEDTASE